MLLGFMVILIVNASEVKSLKSTLAKPKGGGGGTSRPQKQEAGLDEVQQELKDAISKCESLEHKVSDRDSELATTLQSAKEAQVEAQGAYWEIREAKKIMAGKDFNMQSKFVRRKYTLLTRIWCSQGGFADLPRSIADAVEFF